MGDVFFSQTPSFIDAIGVRNIGRIPMLYGPFATRIDNLDVRNGSLFQIQLSASVSITGIKPGITSREIELINDSVFTMTLANMSSFSLPGNQIACDTGADLPVAAGKSVRLFYDDTNNVWATIAPHSGDSGGGGGPATKLIETGGPTTLDIAAIPDGFLFKRSGTTVIGIDPTTLGGTDVNAFHHGGDSFGVLTIFGTNDDFPIRFIQNGQVQGNWFHETLYVGDTVATPYNASHPEQLQIQREINDSVRMIVINPLAGTSATAEVDFVRDDGHTGSIGITSSAYADVGFFADDGLLMVSGGGSSEMAFKFDGDGTTQQQFTWGFRDGPNNGVALNLLHKAGSGRYQLHNFNGPPVYDDMVVFGISGNALGTFDLINQSDGSAAGFNFYTESDSHHYAQWIALATSATDFEPTLIHNAHNIDVNGFGNGLNIQTSSPHRITFRTNMVTRYQIDGDGKMGWNGVTTVSQPTVTGSRGGNAALASLLTAVASLGLIVDGSSA